MASFLITCPKEKNNVRPASLLWLPSGSICIMFVPPKPSSVKQQNSPMTPHYIWKKTLTLSLAFAGTSPMWPHYLYHLCSPLPCAHPPFPFPELTFVSLLICFLQRKQMIIGSFPRNKIHLSEFWSNEPPPGNPDLSLRLLPSVSVSVFLSRSLALALARSRSLFHVRTRAHICTQSSQKCSLLSLGLLLFKLLVWRFLQ